MAIVSNDGTVRLAGEWVKVRTAVDASARRTRLNKAKADAQIFVGAMLQRTTPEQAAERIVRGIIRREGRVLVGRDARQVAAIQRLFPVGYWPLMARFLGRAVRRASQSQL